MTRETTDNSRAIAMNFLRALMDKDIATAIGLFHEDGTFWVPGRKEHVPFAGRYNREQFIQIQKGASSHNDGELLNEIQGVTAEGDRVAVEACMSTVTSRGESYVQDYHHLFVIKDNKVFLWKEYMDTQMNAEHFSALKPPE